MENDTLIGFETAETVLHAHFEWLVEALEWAAAVIYLFAILLLLVGFFRFAAGWIRVEIAHGDAERVREMNRERIELGRYILAGLEVFIVSDVIHAALSLRFSDLLFLGLLVLIRSVTSWFLDREVALLRSEMGE